MKTIRLLGPLAWRNLWRNPRRTIITLIVVAAGLYSILVFASVLQAWAQSSRDTALNLLTGSGQIHAVGYLDDPTVMHRMKPSGQDLEAALNTPPIDAWVGRVRVPAVVQSEYKSLPVTLLGVEPSRERTISVIPDQVADGHYLAEPSDSGIVLGKRLADHLKTRIGKRVIVMAQSSDGSLAQRAFPVVGIFAGNSDAENAYAFTGLQTAQAMLGVGNEISEISFHVTDNAQLNDTIAALQKAAPDLDVSPWTKLSPMAAAVDGFMQSFVYIWLWVMFVFMAIGIINTQLMAVFERVREFGLLQALGMRPNQILILVMFESILLVGAGVLLGMVASVLTILALHGGVDLSFLARGAEYFGAGHILYPRLLPVQFLELCLLVWVLGVVVALWPARKAAQSKPVEAMSHAS